MPSVAGFLIEKELDALDRGINDPKRPLVAIIGGAKVSSKIGVLTKLMEKVDTILIGGAMTYTFIKAQGGNVGKSLVEDDKIDVANQILKLAEEKNVNFILPVDTVVAKEPDENSDSKVVSISEIEDEYMGLDIGPKTIAMFVKEIKQAGTVVWNGPVGMFEIEKFAEGTKK